MKLIPNYSIEELAGRGVLIPEGQTILDGQSVFSINSTAGWYLKQLETDKSIEELTLLAESEFDAVTQEEKKEIREDLESFLNTLRQKGLLDE